MKVLLGAGAFSSLMGLLAVLWWSPHMGTFWFFRLLLQFTQSQQTSFALEKNLRTQQEIEDKMKSFSFKEDTLLWIAEVSVPPGFTGHKTSDIFPGSDTIFLRNNQISSTEGPCLPPLCHPSGLFTILTLQRARLWGCSVLVSACWCLRVGTP